MADLPLAAYKVLQEKAAGLEVTSILVENWGDHTLYIVNFKDDIRYPKLFITADGAEVLH
jgi:hypothetical protein